MLQLIGKEIDCLNRDIVRLEGPGMECVDCTERPSPYRAVNTLRLVYTNQSVNVV